MKKAICLLLTAIICITLFGCAKSDGGNSNAADETIKSETTQAQTKQSTTKTQHNKVDIDLASMSQTVMYAEMSNMQIDPDSYKGKTVKIKGQYNAYQDDKKTKWYYAVVVQDATACCQQGMELEFADGNAPTCVSGDEIEVSGTFDTYTEKVQNCEVLHCVLKNAEIL